MVSQQGICLLWALAVTAVIYAAPPASNENTATEIPSSGSAEAEYGQSPCHYNVTKCTDACKKPVQGRGSHVNKLVVNHFYGTLSTGDHQVPENYLWRIVCKTNGTGSVIVIIRKFSIAPGEHLHVKTRKISGCNVRHWLAFHIQKRSFLVALGFNEANSSYPNSSTSTFEMSYVCIENGFAPLADKILLNEKVLDYLQSNEDAFVKAVNMIQQPYFYIQSNLNDPHVKAIVELMGWRLPVIDSLPEYHDEEDHTTPHTNSASLQTDTHS